MPHITSAERFGIEKGIQLGKQEGTFEAKLEVARNLLNNGVNPTIIGNSTKLPCEKIEALRKQMVE